jgi:peptidoglycan/LPS O-acetylase OafA/YrhL
MESSPSLARQRLVELDGLRGIAALSVLLFHFTTRYDTLFGHQGDPIVSFPKASFGVELFFVISGFVILMTISRTETVWDFIASRFGRLYPAYWAAILLTFSIVSATSMWPHGQPGLRDVLINTTMLQEFVGAQNVDGVYWTLRIELMFYGLIAAFFVLKMIRYIEFLAAGLLALSLADWALNRSSFLTTTAGAAANDLLTLVLAGRRIEFFITGMMLYLCWKNGFTVTRLAIIGIALVVTGIEGGWVTAAVHTGVVALVGVAMLGLISPLRSRPVVFLGFISYTLYLVHQFIGFVVIHEVESRGMNSTLAIICATVATIGLATVLTICIERPAIAFIRRQYKALKTNRFARKTVAFEGGERSNRIRVSP